MTKDRKVSTDALETLGNVIDEFQKRDAIHLAVEPVIAGDTIHPNDDVRIVDGKAYVGSRELGECVGKCDPFLNQRVYAGQWFWLVLYPRTITSLRHVWSHPAFPDPGDVELVEYREEIKDEVRREVLDEIQTRGKHNGVGLILDGLTFL